MFQTKLCRKSIHIFHVQYLFPENHAIYKINVETHGTAGAATDDNMIWCMHVACGMTKATDTHSGHVILIALHVNNGYMNELLCCIYTYIVCLFLAPVLGKGLVTLGDIFVCPVHLADIPVLVIYMSSLETEGALCGSAI
jgi:hypothetical protein